MKVTSFPLYKTSAWI